jgi:hypothetical protein
MVMKIKIDNSIFEYVEYPDDAPLPEGFIFGYPTDETRIAMKQAKAEYEKKKKRELNKKKKAA